MPTPLPMDLHSHSEHSHDAIYPVADMCEAAIKQNIGIFAVTDHYDIIGFDLSFTDLDQAIDRSFADTLAAKELYRGRLQVLAGLELGQPLEKPGKAEEIIRSHPFDYIACALHNAPGRLDAYYYRLGGDDALLDNELEIYFTHLLDMVHWGRFDCAAHITYPFRYILSRIGTSYPFERWDDHIEAVVKALADQGLALELNTAGIRREPAHTIPDARWIKRFRELGGEKLVLGSDAHSPQYVGAGIAEGVRIAADAGFGYLCCFENRKPRYIKI